MCFFGLWFVLICGLGFGLFVWIFLFSDPRCRFVGLGLALGVAGSGYTRCFAAAKKGVEAAFLGVSWSEKRDKKQRERERALWLEGEKAG